MKELIEFLGTTSDMELIILVIGVLAALYILPNVIRRLGVIKLGPLEMEHKHQSQNYEVNRKIENIDILNRENLWEMTEDLFAVAAETSLIGCEAIVGYILNSIASPIRNMVMINHIASKLVKSEEDHLKAKIERGILRAMRDSKKIDYGHGCPVEREIESINSDKYKQLLEDWIMRARSITSKACKSKIKVYEQALEETKDKHWIKVYKSCTEKNREYIRGMGYEL